MVLEWCDDLLAEGNLYDPAPTQALQKLKFNQASFVQLCDVASIDSMQTKQIIFDPGHIMNLLFDIGQDLVLNKILTLDHVEVLSFCQGHETKTSHYDCERVRV